MGDFFCSMIFISVLVKPNAKSDSIGQSPDGQIWIRISEPAKEGKANDGIIRFLSSYLNISKSNIRIKSGQAGRFKIIEIEAPDHAKVHERLDKLSKYDEELKGYIKKC